MTPLGWGWALFVWGYALAWFLLTDRVKLVAYWLLDRTKARANAKSPAAGCTAPKTTPAAKPAARRSHTPKPSHRAPKTA
jgi:H+-transporting ATPase